MTSLVVSCGHDDHVVAVDDIQTGESVFKLTLACGSINGCDLSHNNRTIAVAGVCCDEEIIKYVLDNVFILFLLYF